MSGRDYSAIARKYAKDVVAGKIPAAETVIASCQRHVTDLARWKKKSDPYRFDKKSANRACAFIENLPHTKGEWFHRGELIHLEPWQIFIVCSIFGWLRKDGKRRFRIAYIEVPRKNGKSLLAAAIGLYMLAADGEAGAEVFSGATTQDQAMEVFRPAKLMAERTPAFLEFYGVQVNASNLHILLNGSRMEPVIGKPGDGASPSCWILDEFHEHTTDEQFSTAITGMGAREQPLMLVITTAGSDTAGPCYQLRSDVIKVITNLVNNDEVFGTIYQLDDGDDWTTEEALKKANPNIGVSVKLEYLLSRQREAVNSGYRQNAFLMKHMNRWTSARASWMNMESWKRAGRTALSLDDFAGEPCFMALDLSSKLDITAVTKVFVRDETHYVFGNYYLPEAQIDDPRNAHYAGWANDGHLIVTDGDIIDYERIEADIEADDKRFRIVRVAYDPWGATDLANRLQNKGIEVVEFPMRVSHISEPMKWVEAFTLSGKLIHDENPVLSWSVSNVTAKEDANQNIFPRKERTENKIDPAVSLIMAIAMAMRVEEKKGSIYARRKGLLKVGQNNS